MSSRWSFPSPLAAPPTSLARLMATKAMEEYGQQFIVENKSGAGGNIGADAVAKSDPDGYTFVIGTPGPHVINQYIYKNQPSRQGTKDIVPVIVIARVPNLISVKDPWGVKAKTLQEFIALGQSQPGQALLCSPGQRQHRACGDRAVEVDGRHRPRARAVSRQRAGADRCHGWPGRDVARQSSGRAAVRGGRQAARARGDDRKTLARSCRTCRRSPKPASPATRRRPGSRSQHRPRRRPTSSKGQQERERILHGGCREIAKMRKLGADPVGGSPDDMQRYVLAETEKWGKVAKFAGIKPE